MVAIERQFCPKLHKLVVIWIKKTSNYEFIKRKVPRNNKQITTANKAKMKVIQGKNLKRTNQARIFLATNHNYSLIPIKIRNGLLKIREFLNLR